MFKSLKDIKNNKQLGFTLMEVVVSVGIFVILITAVVQIYILIIQQIASYRQQTEISSLAQQYIEIARNLPYSSIGTLNGNPHGDLADLPNALEVVFGGNNYKIYYAVSYVDDPADGTILAGTDFASNDYKQIKLYIENIKANKTSNFLTNIAPKGLEGLASGGALYINVINAVGEPVSGASIHITNNSLAPAIDLTRTSDANGKWVEVALPISANNYHIEVSKNNYSSDQTFPSTEGNPNPVKPDATVINGQVTSVSFGIDKLSTLTFTTLNQNCSIVPSVGINVFGSKLIGSAPNILKFDNNYTSNSSGLVSLSNIEWDNYAPILTGSNYTVVGTSPAQQVNILPEITQGFTLMLGPKVERSLLVIVKDSALKNPIEGANVNLRLISPEVNLNKITGGSVQSQQSWIGGSGQESFVNANEYFSDDGGVSSNIVPYALRLKKLGENYVSSGSLVSSTFDTGTEQTAYTTITFEPNSQDALTSLKFQIATNNDNKTWNFTGPDGTENTFYEVSGATINSANNHKRYIRYKVFLLTADISKTPVLTSININYVSGCFAPGQVFFPDLPASKNYEIEVNMLGYQTKIASEIDISTNQVFEVLLSQ